LWNPAIRRGTFLFVGVMCPNAHESDTEIKKLMALLERLRGGPAMIERLITCFLALALVLQICAAHGQEHREL
jgi:hypothetical protein